jgi:hypothetical protein
MTKTCPVEGTVMKPFHELDKLFAPCLIPLAVLVERCRADTELPCNEGYQGYWRYLLRAQHPSRIAQITKQQSKAEATVITAFPKNEIQILSAQCPIPDYLAFVRVAPAAMPTGPRSEAVVVPSFPLCEIRPPNKANCAAP